MKTLTHILSLTALLLALPAMNASAQSATPLVRYAFSSAEQPTAPTATAPGLEASKLGFGKTIAEAIARNPADANFTPEGEFSIRSNVLPDGVGADGEHYIEFTLKAPAGKRLAITEVSVAGRRSGNQPGLYAYPRIKSSFDDYTAVIALGQIKSTDSVTLKHAINGLTVEGSVTFRLYLPAINRGSVRVILSEISLSGQLL